MDLGVLVKAVYDLFIVYTFGDIWLGGIFGMFIMIYMGWKMHLSADGWVILMAGMGILFGTYYFSTIGILPLFLIGMAFLVYFLLRRLFY